MGATTGARHRRLELRRPWAMRRGSTGSGARMWAIGGEGECEPGATWWLIWEDRPP